MTVIDKKKRAAASLVRTPTNEQVAPVLKTTIAFGTIGEMRKRLRMKQNDFARLVPISVRSLATLESGTSPSDVVARRIVELKRLIDGLSEVMKSDTIGAWLLTPNQAFDGLKPVEAIDRGEVDRLWAMIYYLRSGVAS